MTEDSSNPNIEWKKTGFGTIEKLSRNINTQEAIKYNAKKSNPTQTHNPVTPADLPAGLKKIRKKIKDVFDEEDDEEDEIIISSSFMSLDESNSLYNALNEEEKKQLRQNETLHNMKMQQDAGKLEALSLAAQTLQENGSSGLTSETVDRVMQSAGLEAKLIENTIKQDLVKGLKLKKAPLSEGKYIQILRGINNIKKVGGIKAVEGLNLQQLERASDEKQVAKILLEKTGRKEPKQVKIAKKKQLEKRLSKLKQEPNFQVSRKNLSLHKLETKKQQKEK